MAAKRRDASAGRATPRTARRGGVRAGTPAADAEAERFMREALAEARKGLGRTHPNPAVGAIVVKNGRVVGRGHHRRAGLPHAEVEALADAGKRAKGADLYVTLEPCDHFGRTPPCTGGILAAGLARVFVGSIDPNPLVSGRGIQHLRREGVAVRAGVLRDECDEVIRGFVKHITTGRPLVVLKAAITLDGKLATATGDSKWVSSPESRALVHRWRDELDAVLVGAGTVLADDPQLTTRLETPVDAREPRTPLRIVLSGKLRIPPTAKVLETKAGPVLVATAEQGASVELLRARGVDVLTLPGTDGRVDVGALLDALGRRGLTSILVEGGSDVHRAFLEEDVVDELRLFIAPRLVGADGLGWVGALGVTEMAHAWAVDGLAVTRSGPDLLVTGRPRRPGA